MRYPIPDTPRRSLGVRSHALAWTLVFSLVATARGQESSDHRPVVSPDGRTLAFMSNRTGTWSIYLMDLEHGEPRRISDDPAGEWYPDWSPDGTRLVYHRAYSEVARQLFIYDVGSGEEIALTPPSGDRSYARWAPDGTTLLFSAGGTSEGRAHRIGVLGDGEEPVLDAPGRQHDATPSPDGEWIAMIRVVENGDGIFLVTKNGEGMRRLTSTGASTYGIDWSPDGRLIAYNTEADGDHELHVLNVATGEDRQITFNGWTDHLPRWLPDGETLIFTSERDETERIYTIRADGTGLAEVDTGHGP